MSEVILKIYKELKKLDNSKNRLKKSEGAGPWRITLLNKTALSFDKWNSYLTDV